MANHLQKADAALIKTLTSKLVFADTVRLPALTARITDTLCLIGDFRLVVLDDGSKAIIFNLTNEKCRLVIGDQIYIAVGDVLSHFATHWEYRHLIPRLLAFAK
jgi:hypothetical protein